MSSNFSSATTEGAIIIGIANQYGNPTNILFLLVPSTNNVKRYGNNGVPPHPGPIFPRPHLESHQTNLAYA
jgi:hypothetical protein